MSVRDGPQAGYLAGPFPDHQQALDMVPAVQAMAEALDPRAVFYAFGTCRFRVPMARPGRLNDRLGLHLGEGKPL